MNVTGTRNSGHLTAEQIDDVLIGDVNHDASGHLAACARCAERVAEARVPLASFKAVSTAWSERRSATLPQISIQNAARPQRLAWGAAAVTAMLGFVIAVPVTQHRERVSEAARAATAAPQMAAVNEPPMVAPVVTSIPSETKAATQDDEQITRDNQMLDVIDQELGATAESPAALELRSVQARPRVRSFTATEQD
jgi:hypothetical protein